MQRLVHNQTQLIGYGAASVAYHGAWHDMINASMNELRRSDDDVLQSADLLLCNSRK